MTAPKAQPQQLVVRGAEDPDGQSRKREEAAQNGEQPVNLLNGEMISTKISDRILRVQTLRTEMEMAKKTSHEDAEATTKKAQVIGKVDGIRRIFWIEPSCDYSLLGPDCVEDVGRLCKITETDRMAPRHRMLAGKTTAEVELGPLTVRWDFYVTLDPKSEVQLGAHFLYYHKLTASPMTHALMYYGQEKALIPLLGGCAIPKFSCRAKEDITLVHGTNIIPIFLCKGNRPPGGVFTKASQLQVDDHKLLRQGDRPLEALVLPLNMPELRMTVPAQLTREGGYVAIEYWGRSALFLPAGWVISRCQLEATGKESQKKIRGYYLNMEKDVQACRMVLVTDPWPAESRRECHLPPKRPKYQHLSEEDRANLIYLKAYTADAKSEALNRDIPNEVEETTDENKRKREDEEYAREAGHDFLFSLPKLPCENSALTLGEEVAVRRLIATFADIFNDGVRPLTTTNLLKARLDTGDAVPISIPPRRAAPQMREAMREEVERLEKDGIIEPSMGSWSAPVVMVRKKGGTQWRMCIDYREVNKHVVIPKQPLPRTDDILGGFHGMRYFSVMDMTSGFHQIEIVEEDRPKTAFVTPDVHRQFKRLPFGFASSPAIFQNMVDLLLGPMKWLHAIGYIDDIIVFSPTFEEHVAHLTKLFEAVRKANLQLHPKKCYFGCKEVKYLGHMVSREGIRASKEAIEAVERMAPPEDVKALQRFLGKCGYYRRFVQNFSRIAAPLFRITSKKVEYQWTQECQEAFEKLKGALTKPPVLAHPDYDKPFILDCDGSGVGLGAVLLQKHEDGEHPIAYASKSLLSHERKWCATELEAAAIIWALEVFRPYIYKVKVLIRTDHAPLSYIYKSSDKCARLQRWALRLREFNFEIQYRSGAQQKHVDCLSRDPLPVPDNPEGIILDEFPERTVLALRAWQVARAPRVSFDETDYWKRIRGQLQVEVMWWNKQRRVYSILNDLRVKEPRIKELPAIAYNLRCNPVSRIMSHEFVSEDEMDDGEEFGVEDAWGKEEDNHPLFGGRDIPLPPKVAAQTMLKLQQEDQFCKTLLNLVTKPREEWPPKLQKLKAQFVIAEEILCVSFPGEELRIVVPMVARDSIVHAHHLSYYSGHFGIHKTYLRVRRRYWWPKLKKFVRHFLRSCTLCMSYAPSGQRPRWLNLPIGSPFEVIAMDIWGKLPTTEEGNKYVLVIIDHHTRWVELAPIGNPTAEVIADNLFTHWIARWGVPRVILTDNGPQFSSLLYHRLCQKYQIRKIVSSPFNPRGNSVVESFMRSLRSTVRLCLEIFKEEWDSVLPAASFAYRTTVHTSTGHSPYFLVTGQDAVLPISRELCEPILNTHGESWLEVIWRCRVKLMEDYQKVAKERLAMVDKRGVKFAKGQIIAIKVPYERRKEIGKFAPQYEGPYEVEEVLANGVSAKARLLGGDRREIVNRCNAKLLEGPPTRSVETYIPRMVAE